MERYNKGKASQWLVPNGYGARLRREANTPWPRSQRRELARANRRADQEQLAVLVCSLVSELRP